MTCGELRAAIVLLRTTQSGLADMLDVTDRTVRRWVSGKDSIPKVVEFAVKYLELKRIGK